MVACSEVDAGVEAGSLLLSAHPSLSVKTYNSFNSLPPYNTFPGVQRSRIEILWDEAKNCYHELTCRV